MLLSVRIKKLYDDVEVPAYAQPGDVGLDLRARTQHTIAPGEYAMFYVGFALEFPDGYAALVMDKGGRAQAGLHTMGGVFDAGYRGEYNVQLINHGTEPYTVEAGDKIAQLVIVPIAQAVFKEVDELSDSVRGEGRLGSTGRQ